MEGAGLIKNEGSQYSIATLAATLAGGYSKSPQNAAGVLVWKIHKSRVGYSISHVSEFSPAVFPP